MSIQDVIAKVRKLQALSSSSSANEAASAMAIANKLIDQYRLSECDLESYDKSVNDPLVEDDGFIYESGKITPWKSSLVNVLAKHYGLACYNSLTWGGASGRRKVSRFKLVGRKSDIEIARYFFAYLASECNRLAEKEAKGMGRVFVGSYCSGFVNGISQQLMLSRAEVKREATSTAIMKLDLRSVEANNFMYSKHDIVKKTQYSQAQRDRLAFSMGQSKGQSIHLGSSLGPSTSKLLGS